MFGYVRAFKPYLRVCEYDTYQAIYCGLCKEMKRLTGEASRLTLSYDITFLAMLNMAVNNIPVKARRERCPVHPVNKRLCVYDNKGLEYPVYASAVLTHYKLYDNTVDGSFAEAAVSKTAMAALERGYKKAREKYPLLDKRIARLMRYQLSCEKKGEAVLDKACDPTAKMMQAILAELSVDKETRKKLSRFGYALGRYVYIADALDDVIKDAENGSYNPLLKGEGITGRLSKSDYKRISERCTVSINLTLAELADSYQSLGLEMYKATLENIIYVGLPHVYDLVRQRKFKRQKRKGEDQ